ncbi:hypothetical protein ACILDT_04595 [Capnocytophaga canis]|uniref:hypothetical protein n=1 Tax=Capnocytophaga TaxID=1016 RepID=UPI000BB1EEA7|nr:MULTISPECIES: hypothetical protein [unclassified Capnocytophaga]ATA72757.1 hypothetical protein CGC49_05290 [Capnocytophaga sp. H4358]ATA74852.1 hypothetical protein CGC52_05045 [Capnocytophaga sp. H2931]
MTAKSKAFLFNFLCFGLIFITIRLGINYFFPELERLTASIISGVVTLFLSPRFAAIQADSGEKLFMKWIFIKGIKQL